MDSVEPRTQSPGRWSGLRPQPFEWAALGFLAVVLVLIHGARLRIDWRSAVYTLEVMLELAPFALAAGLVSFALYHVATTRQWTDYAGALRRPGWWILWLRLWLACGVASFSYFWLKVCVPLMHPGTFDDALWRLDRGLHLGASPSQWLAGWFEGSALAPWLDRWYAFWLLSLVWGIVFFASAADDRLRRRFVLSCVLLWAFGAGVYLALPARGPIYAFPETWSGLTGSLPRAEAAQQALGENYANVLASRTRPTPFRHTLGVAAMPSLHVGFHWLFALWARAAAPPLFVPLVAMTLATSVGAVVTGWHYAVDAYVGAALAWACFWLARRTERRPDDDAPPSGGASVD